MPASCKKVKGQGVRSKKASKAKVQKVQCTTLLSIASVFFMHRSKKEFVNCQKHFGESENEKKKSVNWMKNIEFFCSIEYYSNSAVVH